MPDEPAPITQAVGSAMACTLLLGCAAMAIEPDAAEVKASGGVVWRRGERGVEVVVVHRPRYDDWSLPKGKLDPGEGWEQAALREVEEEVGLRCRLRGEPPPPAHTGPKGPAEGGR